MSRDGKDISGGRHRCSSCACLLNKQLHVSRDGRNISRVRQIAEAALASYLRSRDGRIIFGDREREAAALAS